MKSKALIISFLVISLIGAFKLKATAQERDKCPSVVNSSVNPNPILLADETTLTYCKTEAIIVCDNQTIYKKLHATHSQLFKRSVCTLEFDGRHYYKRYVIYIDKGDSQILITWAKSHL